MSFLPGMFPGAAVGGPFSASVTDFQSKPAATSVTSVSSSVAIGTAAGNRRVVVAVNLWEVFGSISSVTIGGVAATVHIANSAADGTQVMASAIVPSGTTAAVVLNFAGAENPAGWTIAAYSLVNPRNANPAGTLSVAVDSLAPSGAIDIPDGGCLIASAAMLTFANASFTWTGATEHYDTILSTSWVSSGAFVSPLAAQTGRTVTATLTNTTTHAAGLMAMSWR